MASGHKQDKQKKGLFVGGKASYGYKLSTEKNKIVIDEAVAPNVTRMFELAATGMSCRQIAILFNKEQIPPPAVYAKMFWTKDSNYSGLWCPETVSHIIL